MAQGELQGRVALITGGAHRIGGALARALHAEGMRLVIHYHSSEAAAHALQAELHEIRPDSVMLVRGDLGAGERLARNLVFETVEAFERLDVLVNNASKFYAADLAHASEAQWDDIIGVNLKAPFFLAQAAAPHLRKHAGCVVNIVDIYGERPLPGYPIYSIAKAGLIMLTRVLARELGPEVRANAIAPGAILWPDAELDEMSKQRIISRTPLKRSGDPADIARAALYLIRDGGYVTGQVIAVDGGRTVVI